MKYIGSGAKYIRLQKQEMIYWSKRLAKQGILSGLEGNISLRLGQEHLLITRSMADKRVLSEDDILLINLQGELIEKPIMKDARVSSEFLLHKALYAKSPESRTLIHAHPVYAILYGLLGLKEAPEYLAEPILYFGKIPVAPFALPGGMALAETILPFLPQSKAILLQGHGALTHHTEINMAGAMMEMLEKVCRIYYKISNQETEGTFQLNKSDIEQLQEMHQKINF